MAERNRKSNQYRFAGLTAAAVLVMLGIGCTKRDTNQVADTSGRDTTVDTTRPVTTAAPDRTLAVEDPGLSDIPGRDPIKTLEYLRKLDGHWSPTPETVSFRCHENECPRDSTVHIAIYTHELTLRIDPRSILKTNSTAPGHIALKMVNLDRFAFEPLGLEARDSVYLWVGKTDTNGQPNRRERAFAVYQIDQQGSAKGVSRAYGAIHCKRDESPASEVHVMRKGECQGGTRKVTDLYRTNLSPGKHDKMHDSGLWFSCTGGCCQANTFGDF